jgi:polysaccharide export outer membrane protein
MIGFRGAHAPIQVMFGSNCVLMDFFKCSVASMVLSLAMGNWAVAQTVGTPRSPPTSTASQLAETSPIIQLGPSDTVSIGVYGQPDMNATVYISDDGTVPVAFAGAVKVAGLSPADAAKQIEKALRDGKFFNDPHVTITLVQSRSQRVSVLGEVGTVGRFPIESNTTLFDLLALAGGLKETAASVIYLLRTDTDGKLVRYPIKLDLAGSNDALAAVPTHSLKGGDSILVPHAEYYYMYGEVARPDRYRLEPGLTLLEALVRAGGVNPRGSEGRIELKRHGADGHDVTRKAKPDEELQADDVIRVKERIF